MRAVTLLRRLDRYDRAAYRSVAQLRIPLLDEPLRLVSDFANFSKPWFLVSGFLALFGGGRGRRAALTGLAAIGTASLVVNQPMKMAGERHRPDRDGVGVPQQRWVRMPSSTSFPSGHSASAGAFAVAVGNALPAIRLPLRAAAAVVAFSRVYTGVHYPGDVLVGAAVGTVVGQLISGAAARPLLRANIGPPHRSFLNLGDAAVLLSGIGSIEGGSDTVVVTRCSFERGSPMVDRLRTDQEVVVRSPDQRSWLTSRPEVLTAISRARAPRGRVAAQRFWAGFPDWVVRIGNRIGV